MLLFTWGALDVSGQVEVLKPYKAATDAPPPVKIRTIDLPPQSVPATKTAPVAAASKPAASTADADSDAKARRAAALAKVQNAQLPVANPNLSAKGLTPAQYSTDAEAMAPVEYMAAPPPSTTMTVNGQNVERKVRKGSGQVGDDLFTPISELYFVQFAVYCKNTPVDKAPSIQGLFLLWHEGSTCPGGDQGATYIVKGYTTIDEAKTAVLDYKKAGIDCWYNPSLSGAEVEIIGVR